MLRREKHRCSIMWTEESNTCFCDVCKLQEAYHLETEQAMLGVASDLIRNESHTLHYPSRYCASTPAIYVPLRLSPAHLVLASVPDDTYYSDIIDNLFLRAVAASIL